MMLPSGFCMKEFPPDWASSIGEQRIRIKGSDQHLESKDLAKFSPAFASFSSAVIGALSISIDCLEV